jgi:hypothetical protein
MFSRSSVFHVAVATSLFGSNSTVPSRAPFVFLCFEKLRSKEGSLDRWRVGNFRRFTQEAVSTRRVTPSPGGMKAARRFFASHSSHHPPPRGPAVLLPFPIVYAARNAREERVFVSGGVFTPLFCETRCCAGERVERNERGAGEAEFAEAARMKLKTIFCKNTKNTGGKGKRWMKRD